MPEVLERGYLYIAQPPLYKVKKGQKERYLKNEHDLAEFLLTSGLEGITIHSGGKPVPNSQVTTALKSANRLTKSIDRMAKRLHPEVLRSLIRQGVTAETLATKEALEKVMTKIASEAMAKNISFSYVIAKDAEHGSFFATIENTIKGSKRIAPLNHATLTSPEYEELLKHNAAMQTMGAGPVEIVTDGKAAEKAPETAPDGEALALKNVEKAKQGLVIQRYKGLGEMNPEQLWETTMDPARRTLLRVNVSDAVEADGVFSVLMGDAVEPRRAFIEENALRVRNLDI
jgi:DNA gyrase subunit B